MSAIIPIPESSSQTVIYDLLHRTQSLAQIKYNRESLSAVKTIILGVLQKYAAAKTNFKETATFNHKVAQQLSEYFERKLVDGISDEELYNLELQMAELVDAYAIETEGHSEGQTAMVRAKNLHLRSTEKMK